MDNKHRFILWTVVLVAAVTLLPFLGLTDFTTKGEPREAVVAVSMLNQHNWILPINNGVDIPYKPPFFQWCIAAFSLPFGHVTEFTSRLPSALALIIMLAMGAVFYAKRKNRDLSFLAAMLTLTAFEVHRAGTNCRVDMVLTMFIVCALFAFYKWWEGLSSASSKGGVDESQRCKGLPWLAILCMSGATLTKGPVGIVLPCFVMFVFLGLSLALSKGEEKSGKWLIPFLKLFLSAVLACILPALWYIAAYKQGGNEFLGLVMDENVGRFLGKMKVVTHQNPWYYNILTLISGWLPWTLPLLLSLLMAGLSLALSKGEGKSKSSNTTDSQESTDKSTRVSTDSGIPSPSERARERLLPSPLERARERHPVQLFTWLSFLLILFFYCIPKSKRSVYLLPCYPFMAVLIVEYAVWMIKKMKKTFPLRFYIGFLTVVGFLLTALLVVVRTGAVPDTIFHGKHAFENIQILHALAYNGLGVGDIILIMLPLVAACLGLMILLHRQSGFITQRPLLASTLMTLLIYISYSGYYKPAVMNPKSYRPFAMEVGKVMAAQQPTGASKLYAFTGESQQTSDPLRFYGVDFYLGDCMRQFGIDKPATGLVMVNKGNDALLHKKFKEYNFKEVYRSKHRETEFKDTIVIYRFNRQ